MVGKCGPFGFAAQFACFCYLVHIRVSMETNDSHVNIVKILDSFSSIEDFG